MTDTNRHPLQTARLALRPLMHEDAEALFIAFGDAETMRYMDQPTHTTIAQTHAHLARMLSPGSCWWAILHQEETQPVGFVGFLGNTTVPGMGYLLRRQDWRQGYMTEAVAAALAYGFTKLGLNRVELWINDGNIASQRLAERSGFTRRSQFRMRYPHEATAHDKVVYGLYRYEWQARPGRAAVQPRACYGIQPILAAGNVQETVDFYCNQLGFGVDFLVGDPPTYGAVAWRDWSAENAAIQLRTEVGLDRSRKAVGLFVFVGPAIDALYARYQTHGVTIVNRLATQPWGMREFTVEDCNGYLLRFGTAV
ncbi:MAG: GNAT family N-acetyltransferase [Caldilineaceae bacterium]